MNTMWYPFCLSIRFGTCWQVSRLCGRPPRTFHGPRKWPFRSGLFPHRRSCSIVSPRNRSSVPKRVHPNCKFWHNKRCGCVKVETTTTTMTRTRKDAMRSGTDSINIRPVILSILNSRYRGRFKSTPTCWPIICLLAMSMRWNI